MPNFGAKRWRQMSGQKKPRPGKRAWRKGVALLTGLRAYPGRLFALGAGMMVVIVVVIVVVTMPMVMIVVRVRMNRLYERQIAMR
jgi:hypothetical protein